MGNRQDTFDSCADSYSIDRNGFIWAYIHSISDFDRDRNYFFYSFQSINRENGEKEDRYSPEQMYICLSYEFIITLSDK